MSNSTIAELLVYVWSVWEIQTMVLLSFMVQLFLLATGSLRRHKINVALKVLIWLAYVGADFVAVYALGLFSQYEKYKLGRDSSGDTLPFLWVPFLLLHLGGQDSITAFSLEDNNLWLRHLLNLVTQGVLALFVFWKSFQRISYNIVIPAMFVFVSGIIKYGERVWALKGASRNSLAESAELYPPEENEGVYPSKESYAFRIVLLARGFFAGRTMYQQMGLRDIIRKKFEDSFQCYGQEEGKLKMVAMELGMMFDLLYTKALVLQRWTGVLFRCASQTSMVVAFLLFLLMRSEKGAHHNKVNVAISYTLFTGAIFMEACSVAVVITSPWTRAHLKERSFFYGICNFAASFCEANKSMHRTSIGQFNYMDYCIAMKYKPRIMSKVIFAIGLDKQWRNLWYVHHHRIYASRSEKQILSGVVEILGRIKEIPRSHHHQRSLIFQKNQRSLGGRLRCLGSRLNITLDRPFEHAIYCLHIHTDLHITRHFAEINSDVILQLKEECETLSNYMMYLMLLHPSMLPVSAAAQDLEPHLLKWVSNVNLHGEAWTKINFLDKYTRFELEDASSIAEEGSPFEILTEVKEMWLRLLMYAAGKCHGEVHARQLGEGGELITFVWLLMVHHDLGDVCPTKLKLLKSKHQQDGSTESRSGGVWIRLPDKPFYAFDLCDDSRMR